MDNVRIWDYELPLLDVAAVNNGTLPDIDTASLVTYLRFNNNVVDQTTNDTYTAANVSYVNGLYSGAANGAVEFNSVNDEIYSLNSDTWNFSNGTTDTAFSVSFVVNIDTVNVNDIVVEYGDRGAGGASIDRQWSTSINEDSGSYYPRFLLWDFSVAGTETDRLDRSSNEAISLNNTYHLTFTYDGSGTEAGMNIYVNGVAVTSFKPSTGSGGYVAGSGRTHDLYIGNASHDNTGSTTDFDGTLDGLAIWDKELSQAEVTAIYNKQSAGNELL